MSVSSEPASGRSLAALNLPNQLTIARLVLSAALFGLLSFGWYRTSFVAFIVAASTDWLDGYLARKYGLVTMLGRILDPFADKIIICGTFIFLASLHHEGSGIHAWMAVVVVARELLVTALRSFLEQRGNDFSAAWSGKIKMVLQCLAAGTSLFFLSEFAAGRREETWLVWLLWGSIWGAVAVTVYSGAEYAVAALRLLRR